MSALARRLALTCVVLVGVGWCGTAADAQVLYGNLVGTVTDASGAAIPGATVTITATDTNLARTAVSTEAGAYSFTNVPAGPYAGPAAPRPGVFMYG